MASLTAEDGITLGIGLAAPCATAAPAGGLVPHALVARRAQSYAAAPTPVTGQVNLNTVTYPSLTFPVVATPTATPTITVTPTPTGTPVNSANGLNVYLGYADSLRPNPNLPVPWQGSPNTTFVGHADSSGAYDSGAIRLDNTTAATVTVKDVSVILHTVNSDGTGGPAPGQSFDLWGTNSIAPGDSLILAATGPGDNFDTSDFPLAGTSCTAPAGPTDNPPHLTLTFADNSQVTMTDTAHVLDTGGYDTVNCPGGNESLQWRALGSTGIGQASGALTLTVPAATQIAGMPYSQVATLTDAAGQLQPNVAVNFSITSGPNSGLTGQAVTDSQGRATFTYTSSVAGTDTLAASVTNASGGVLTATPVSVTWAPPPVADLALQAVSSGLNVRLVLHNASSSGPFTLALSPAPGTLVSQDADGVVRVTQPITDYTDSGNPYPITPTEYLVQNPIATDSSADPAAPVTTGPATTTLLTTSGGPQYLAVNVDPTWLHDPHRTFPVTVDLPLVTALSYENMGLVGSVNSCAVTTVAPPTDLVVGSENGCTYNGQLYFNLAGVPYDTPILSATLRLYTPNATGTTGVQLAQNVAPPPGSDPAQPPNWTTAPATVAGAPAIAQSGSNGHWQSWDVSRLVQQWVHDGGSSNGGLTLASSGTPVRFAGPLGAANADPALAPSLQISYGSAVPPANPRSGPYYDTAHTIYGEAGSYTIHGEGVSNGCPTAARPDITCPSVTQNAPHYLGNLKPSAVAYALGGQFIRFNVQLACPSYSQYGINPNAPGRYWWSTNYDNPLKNSNGQVIDWATPNNEGDAGSILAAAVKYDGEIPIITLSPNGACPGEMTPYLWYNQAADFVSYLYAAIGNNSMVYFEIGNEPNDKIYLYTDGTTFDGVDGQNGTYHYADVFAAAAHGIQSAVLSGSMYRILTAGMFSPTADRNKRMCGTVPGYNVDNVVIAGDAIRLAEQPFSAQQQQIFSVPAGPVVSSQHLGVAVHPYGDNSPGTRWWKNYYTTYNIDDPNDPGYKKRHLNQPNNACGQLGVMLNTWTNTRNIPGHLPVIFTEDNWSPSLVANWPAEGAYLADLFTWLYDHDKQYHIGTPSLSPLRVLVFRGADAGAAPLGIYQVDGSDKPADGTSNSASAAIPLPACQTTAIKPGVSYSIAHNYYYLRYAACYP